jgi:hypothetical protein
MAKWLTLKCRNCGNTLKYDRRADPNLPKEVMLIETDECDKCEHSNGDFGGEYWFDKDGKEIVPE